MSLSVCEQNLDDMMILSFVLGRRQDLDETVVSVADNWVLDVDGKLNYLTRIIKIVVFSRFFSVRTRRQGLSHPSPWSVHL